jgi:hypothetical protein
LKWVLFKTKEATVVSWYDDREDRWWNY